MLKLSKKVEYGMIALQYIAENPEKKISAKEMSDKLNISFEFLSKTLQQLMKRGLIESWKGLKGGYALAKSPQEISVADVIDALDGNTSIVDCIDEQRELGCTRDEFCTIRHNMMGLQLEINNVFNNITLAEMLKLSNLN